jgi:hypothetical protein
MTQHASRGSDQPMSENMTIASAGERGTGRSRPPRPFVSQRSRVLVLEREILELRAQIRELLWELKRKKTAARQKPKRVYRCFHCGKERKLSHQNPCVRLVKPTNPEEK